MKISALILTHNEERNIRNCLEAVRHLDDIVVVDSGSTDQTCVFAKEYGARILTRSFDNFANQRNFGLDEGNFKNEWVLHLDADEVATGELLDAIASLQPSSEIDGYQVPSKIILKGRWLRYSGMYPAYQVRLGHRSRMRFKQAGHGQREALSLEKIATLSEPYLHYNFSHGMTHWLQKHVIYAEAEAAQLLLERKSKARIRGLAASDSTVRRRALKQLANQLPVIFRPPLRFIYSYFIRRGFLDGWAGLQYAAMLSCYEAMIVSYVLDKKIEPLA